MPLEKLRCNDLSMISLPWSTLNIYTWLLIHLGLVREHNFWDIPSAFLMGLASGRWEVVEGVRPCTMSLAQAVENRGEGNLSQGPESDSAAQTLIRTDKQEGCLVRPFPNPHSLLCASLLHNHSISLLPGHWMAAPSFVCDTLARY